MSELSNYLMNYINPYKCCQRVELSYNPKLMTNDYYQKRGYSIDVLCIEWQNRNYHEYWQKNANKTHGWIYVKELYILNGEFLKFVGIFPFFVSFKVWFFKSLTNFIFVVLMKFPLFLNISIVVSDYIFETIKDLFLTGTFVWGPVH